MTYIIARTTYEIENQLNLAVEVEATGVSNYPSMTYEQGVKDGLEWVFGETNEPPIPETDEDED